MVYWARLLWDLGPQILTTNQSLSQCYSLQMNYHKDQLLVQTPTLFLLYYPKTWSHILVHIVYLLELAK